MQESAQQQAPPGSHESTAQAHHPELDEEVKNAKAAANRPASPDDTEIDFLDKIDSILETNIEGRKRTYTPEELAELRRQGRIEWGLGLYAQAAVEKENRPELQEAILRNLAA